MPEPVATLGTAAIAAYLGKDGLQKLLGPTADYLGGELQKVTEKRIENIGNILSNATKKLGERLDEPGAVPPRVLKTVVNEGSYCDGSVAAEYFGGIIASSRSEISRDDRGARIAKILDGLSTYQMHSHYVIYSCIKSLFSDTVNSFSLSEGRRKMQIFIPMKGFSSSMNFTEAELTNPQILSHIFHGLSNEDLIEGSWQFGPAEDMKIFNSRCPGQGISCMPSALGAELFLSAFGVSNEPLDAVLRSDLDTSIEGIEVFTEGLVSLATK